jgi:phosphoglycerate-specific signal transduction histidine kinase
MMMSAQEMPCATPVEPWPRAVYRAANSPDHELNEALCAITNYLLGAEKLVGAPDPLSQQKLASAIGNAVAQISRAGEIIRGRRTTASRQSARVRDWSPVSEDAPDTLEVQASPVITLAAE